MLLLCQVPYVSFIEYTVAELQILGSPQKQHAGNFETTDAYIRCFDLSVRICTACFSARSMQILCRNDRIVIPSAWQGHPFST